jgi:hypothetical protein
MRQVLRLVSVSVLSFLTVGCGADVNSSLPVGPSSTTASGATITGTVNGVSSAGRAWSTAPGTTANTAPAGITVTVVGTTLSTTVSGTGTFTLTGVPAGTVQLRFSGPGIDATLTITGVSTEQIQIVVTLSGSSANVDTMNRTPIGGAAEVEGLISAISYGDRSMKVAGVEVKVRNAPIFQGSTQVGLTTLQVGYRVHVKGTKEHDYIVAAEVIVKDATANPNASGTTVEFEGSLTGLTGSCPSISFKVNGTTTAAASATEFRNGPCGHLEEASVVKVQGKRQADGSVVADKIEMKQVQVKGAVAALSGACPSLTLSVNGSVVNTDAFSVFERVTCSGLAQNMKVDVTGSAHPNGIVKATRVKFEG